jgi:hypothetical protein
MNWRTTSLGLITALTSILSIASSVLRGDAITDLPTHIAAITAGFGLLFARDAAAK